MTEAGRMLDDKRLDELDRLERKATPGPWAANVEPWGWEVRSTVGTLPTVFDDGSAAHEYGDVCFQEDRDFIVALRNSAREMISTIRAQRAKIEKLERRIADIYADQRDAAWERDISD